MDTRQELHPGSFCWVDIAVADAKRSLDFFTELFGWGRRVRPTPDGQAYSIFTGQGSHIAGFYEVDGDGPSQWMSYLLVDDLEKAMARAASLGATILSEPEEIVGFGTMAMVQDPVDVVFALWQSAKMEKAPPDGFGVVSWNELITDQTEKAREFYTKMFGWTCSQTDFGELKYTVFMNGETQAGGMMAPNGSDGPPYWLVHFSVENCDDTVARVKELGGRVLTPPTDFEGVGRSAVVTGPKGGAFGVITLQSTT